MSSIVNKSGIRFAPKAKQRRSTTGTPVASRRASVTPTPDAARRSIDASYENNQASEDQDVDHSSDDNSEDEGEDASKSSTIEMPKPSETKQRRLSTLSNISNRDIFKKVSVQSGYTHDSTTSSNADRKTHIIGIPQPPAPTKRRRSTISQSRRGLALKRKSVSEAPGAPSSTTSASVSATSSVPPPATVSEVPNKEDTEKEPVAENEAPVEKQASKPVFLTPTVPSTTDKGKEDEPLSPTDSSSQDPFTSSLPNPSTLPSSAPPSAPESSQPAKSSEVTTTGPTITSAANRTRSRPIITTQLSGSEITRNTRSAAASKGQSPVPVGLPIMRPSSAPTLSKAEAKAPEDDRTSSPASPSTKFPEIEKKSDIGEMKEGLIYDQEKGKLRKITYDPKDESMSDQIITFFKVNAEQISKNFHSISADLLKDVTIDEDTFLMNDLCKPTLPIGKVSSNFQQAQAARKSKMKQRKERRNLRLLARQQKVSLASLTEGSAIKNEVGEDGKEEDQEDSKPPVASSSNAAIQLKVGADGNIIVDEESRVLDRHAGFNNDDRERYDQNPFENVVNSATYGKQRYTDKWETDEVLKFYKALGQWGTDFGLIAQMFPHRTRRQVKAKFILEEKKRPRLVDLALNNKLNSTFDFDSYCADANKTFGTLNDFNAKLEQLKKDHEESLKELSAAREKAKEEDAIRQKQRELEVKSGVPSNRQMTRQERLMELRKHETVLGSIDDVKRQREEEEAASAAAAASATAAASASASAAS